MFNTYISTKSDGNIGFVSSSQQEKVLTCRQKIAEKAGFSLGSVIAMQQSHTANVRIVSQADAGRGAKNYESAIPKTDALITPDQNLVLLTLSADCPLVGLYDPVKHIVGVVHSGWRGTAKNSVPQTIQTMGTTFNSRPENIHAFISPAAGVCCYEVGEEVASSFRLAKNDVISYQDSKYYLNLPLAIVYQCLETGVQHKNIQTSSVCTICNKDYFSYRREEASTGRFGLFVWQE